MKLMLMHPDATHLQLAKCLCSPDNRNFEFLDEFELGAAMRQAWPRLAGVDCDDVFAYLKDVCDSDKSRIHVVAHVLECIKTPRALAMLETLSPSSDAPQ